MTLCILKIIRQEGIIKIILKYYSHLKGKFVESLIKQLFLLLDGGKKHKEYYKEKYLYVYLHCINIYIKTIYHTDIP